MRTSMFDNLKAIKRRQIDIAIEENRGCWRCGTTIAVRRGVQNTAYHYEGEIGGKDDPNFVNLCEPCWKENEKWREAREYYSKVL